MFYVKRMAEFMGYSFSLEEEDKGMVQKIIIDLCSFENLSKLEVNRSGQLHPFLIQKKNAFFLRKGEIGDWKNYLTLMMAAHLDEMAEKKLRSSGLTFNVPSNARIVIGEVCPHIIAYFFKCLPPCTL